jgi:hypothetical protein
LGTDGGTTLAAHGSISATNKVTVETKSRAKAFCFIFGEFYRCRLIDAFVNVLPLQDLFDVLVKRSANDHHNPDKLHNNQQRPQNLND